MPHWTRGSAFPTRSPSWKPQRSPAPSTWWVPPGPSHLLSNPPPLTQPLPIPSPTSAPSLPLPQASPHSTQPLPAQLSTQAHPAGCCGPIFSLAALGPEASPAPLLTAHPTPRPTIQQTTLTASLMFPRPPLGWASLSLPSSPLPPGSAWPPLICYPGPLQRQPPRRTHMEHKPTRAQSRRNASSPGRQTALHTELPLSALSGGCFQSVILCGLSLAVPGQRLFTHILVLTGDGGVSWGYRGKQDKASASRGRLVVPMAPQCAQRQ